MTPAGGPEAEKHRRARSVVYGVIALWLALFVVAVGWGVPLDAAWTAWREAFWAAAVWGANLLLLYYVVGPPFAFSRLPLLSLTFALLMTAMGSGSYWATIQLFPRYRVPIERAALFTAVCTALSLIGCVAVARLLGLRDRLARWQYVWDWGRLRLVTYALFAVCAVGTYMSIQKIGYIPAVLGDPESLRVEFPEIAGAWFRLSMLGMVVGLIAGVQICARRANWLVWLVGALGLGCASLYGNRFFIALPVGAVTLLWDRVRGRVSARSVALAVGVGMPALALLYFWRQHDTTLVGRLGPLGLILYGSLNEFRDLAWTLDYYSGGGHPLLGGSTLGGLIVPLLPSGVWDAVGIDKIAVFAHSNAAVLAQEMGQTTAQRVGIYGDLFMNFGWVGALIGALFYGVLLGYLDRGLMAVRDGAAVRGVLFAVIAAAAVYAQVGQWNMFTSAVTSCCYPVLLLALFTARRAPRIV
jgi:hypothetical protein